MSRFLVTGGAGFIGSNLVHVLLHAGHEVRVLDNFSTGKQENVASLRSDIELIEGDIRDLGTCRQAVNGVEFVLHQAALGSVPRSIADPLATHESNVNGTLNMLIAAKEQNVRKIVLAGSSSAYGDTPVLPKVESMTPLPLSPYAVSKLVSEYYASVFYKVYGLDTICLRYFNVFGPRQNPDSQYAAVIPRFVTKLMRDEAPEIHGDGEQSRAFTYIDNVLQANLLACEAGQAASGQVFNIACTERITLNELFARLKQLLGKDIEPTYTSVRQGDVKHSLADISLAHALLGYDPKVDIAEGLERTVSWYRSVHEQFTQST